LTAKRQASSGSGQIPPPIPPSAQCAPHRPIQCRTGWGHVRNHQVRPRGGPCFVAKAAVVQHLRPEVTLSPPRLRSAPSAAVRPMMRPFNAPTACAGGRQLAPHTGSMPVLPRSTTQSAWLDQSRVSSISINVSGRARIAAGPASKRIVDGSCSHALLSFCPLPARASTLESDFITVLVPATLCRAVSAVWKWLWRAYSPPSCAFASYCHSDGSPDNWGMAQIQLTCPAQRPPR
jgi:hypothetical protein